MLYLQNQIRTQCKYDNECLFQMNYNHIFIHSGMFLYNAKGKLKTLLIVFLQ